MSYNKNAVVRYQTLDNCFRNPGRKYFIEDLLEACNQALIYLDPKLSGIKRRQLFEDIRFMESEKGWSVPLERFKEGKKVFYHYSDLKFSINNSPLKETEAEQLKSALMVLSRFKGSPEFTWVQELIPKLEQTFNLKGDTKAIISFDDNRYLEGIEYIGKLFHAILRKQPLEIAYKSYNSEKPNVSVIHPYYLKQYNNRWYLLGQTERFDSLSVRALDRIVDFKEVDIPFIENTQYDFEEYFEDVIGINTGKNRSSELIRLWFSPEKAPYILTKPLHGSQKKKVQDENGLVITIEVISNYELKSLLLSFGREVKVLSPASLDLELKEMNYR